MDKEQLKEMRKLAYKKAKEKRDCDPEYLSMKQKAKEKRQALYQAHKEKIKKEKEEARLKRVKQRDEELIEAFGLEKLRLLKFDSEIL